MKNNDSHDSGWGAVVVQAMGNGIGVVSTAAAAAGARLLRRQGGPVLRLARLLHQLAGGSGTSGLPLLLLWCLLHRLA